MSNSMIHTMLEKFIHGYWPEYEVIRLDNDSSLILYLADATELKEGDEEGKSLRRAELSIKPKIYDHLKPIEFFNSLSDDQTKEEKKALVDTYMKWESAVLGKDEDLKLQIAIPTDMPERIFVNGYEVSREYGGPEEGGWYYDQFHPVSSFLCIDEVHAEQLMAQLTDQYREEKPEDDRWSTVGTPDMSVRIQKHPALRDPLYRPHYE